MARRKQPAPAAIERQVVCAASECSARFAPQRSTARYCSKTCRQRASRARKAAEAAAEIDAVAESGQGGAEHELVKAVRNELGEAASSVTGQLALQLARRMADPQVSGFSALSRELRSLLSEAKPPPAPDSGPDPASAEPEDEVKKARRAREEARQAAGRS